MNAIYASQLLALALFIGILVLVDVGRRLGERRLSENPESARSGLAAIEGAVFALLGLLLAFTFSGTATRFEARRTLVVQEANAIGTAWLRIDLLPAAAQPGLRAEFRRYVDARLEVYAQIPRDLDAAKAALARSEGIQREIWKKAVAACATPEGQRGLVLVIPSLNEMFDIVTTRTTALRIHTPLAIYAMLTILVFASSLLAGHSMAGARRRSWIHIVGFALVLAFTVYLILDLEYPRGGLIRVDATDLVLSDLRHSFD